MYEFKEEAPITTWWAVIDSDAHRVIIKRLYKRTSANEGKFQVIVSRLGSSSCEMAKEGEVRLYLSPCHHAPTYFLGWVTLLFIFFLYIFFIKYLLQQ
jgi:hypothetical protein